MRMTPTLSVLIVFATALTTAGCSPTFSRQSLEQVDRGITFREIQSNPDAYLGKSVMLGGVIIETRNTQEGSFIEVLQRPITRQGRPVETDETEGRFIISSPQFLDSAVYYPGKRISVIGTVAGQKIQPLGGIQYHYPVVTAKELRLWEPRTSPQFSFGFGLGIFHRF